MALCIPSVRIIATRLAPARAEDALSSDAATWMAPERLVDPIASGMASIAEVMLASLPLRATAVVATLAK